MNPYETLIWEYSSKEERWYDATERIEWVKDDYSAWFVKFKNLEKPIHVSYSYLSVYKKVEQINYLVIEHNGVPQYKTKQCLIFDNKFIKLFFESGYILTRPKEEFKIYKDTLKDNPTAKGILNYYRSVVQHTAKTEEDVFMLSQFDKIAGVNDESVLSLYFNKQNGQSTCPNHHSLIAPFGTNLSQLKAIKTGFSKRISIIEGPPGTGKTQTILNFIANAVCQGFKVAVVSNNNAAIENVYEKLDKNGFGFLTALLGNRENIDEFFENLDISVPNFETENYINYEKIGEYNYKLPILFEKQNEKNKLLEEIDQIKLELKHFEAEHPDLIIEKKIIKDKKLVDIKLVEALCFLKEIQKEKHSIFFKWKIRRLIKCKKSFISLPLENQIEILERKYFDVKIRDKQKKIAEIDKELEEKTFDQILKDFQDLSMKVLKKKVMDYYQGKRTKQYTREDYKLDFASFVNDFPIVLSSTYSLAQCTKNGYLFDYLIVDESSQVNMASAILSMLVAKNIIIVGDTKQLPQIDDSSFAKYNDILLNKYNVDGAFSYQGNSIMTSIISVYGDRVPRTLLKEHYRCNPSIIGFCNKEFYDNELIVYSTNSEDSKPLKLIKLVEGNHARKNPNNDEGGFYSEREADEINKLVKKEKFEDLGIITPYRIQVKTLEKKLNDSKIDISTIHKFQGREKKNIIFSTVVNESNDFVDDPNMINVAVSRAVDSFILIAADKVVKSNSGILSDLVNYIKYHSEISDVEEGTISSIYDLLYSDYQDELEKFRLKHKSKDYDTENLTKQLLLDILKDSKFKHLKFSMHVPLREIFKGKFIKLNYEEKQFFFHPWTHADFVIYNKMSNKPVMIIEVDGVSFHEQQEKQKVRDAIKDSIVERGGLKLLRLKTNESNERERILEALN